MPKRKNDQCSVATPISLTSLDAALDLLACETFTRLQYLTKKFEAAAKLNLSEGIMRSRWDEAVRRYWVMKGMDDLCCSAKINLNVRDNRDAEGEVKMDDINHGGPANDEEMGGRPLPSQVHPGAPVVHSLATEEELEWRRWSPKTGDAVLVELGDGTIWPGKIIDKKTFFQGRTQPRGNHFFAVRFYSETMQPTVTIKSRLLPLHLRKTPPLLASTALISAYNHATNPTSFDMRAAARESLEAHNRTHPGVGTEVDRAKIKADKASWNELINWVMGERRVEKLRAVEEERNRRLREVATTEVLQATGEATCEQTCGKKRRTVSNFSSSEHPPFSSANSIFGPISSPLRSASPSIAGIIRPALSTPQRPSSPRRLPERRRSVYNGMGEYSPRGRGGTYTPPRILPSGDETSPFVTGSPAPSLPNFDFISPLGPVRLGHLEKQLPSLGRKGSLEAVKEEAREEGDDWTIVSGKRSKRAGSLPCREKAAGMPNAALQGNEMALDV